MVRTKELDQFSNAAWSVGVRRESVIAPLAKRSRATQDGGLRALVPSDAKQFNQKMAVWPDEHKSLLVGPNYTR